MRRTLMLVTLATFAAATGCAERRPGEPLRRAGDEIVVCGRFFHTGTPVVLWMDAGGYDAYRVEPRLASAGPGALAPRASSAPAGGAARPDRPEGARYGTFRRNLPPAVADEVRRDGWRLERLREHVDLFVLHYDACGTSRRCFEVLHDVRGLSVHFMIDLDGTIYQTLDVKERAWHAAEFNDRSVGVEIAHIGAYESLDALQRWYRRRADGRMQFLPPLAPGALDADAHSAPAAGLPALRTPGFVPLAARDEPIRGFIHGRELVQYDFTPQQYAALARLTATLCRVLPRIRPAFPRGPDGRVAPRVLTAEELSHFSGVLGHYHLTEGKIDPGPAFDWERLARDLRALGGGQL